MQSAPTLSGWRWSRRRHHSHHSPSAHRGRVGRGQGGGLRRRGEWGRIAHAEQPLECQFEYADLSTGGCCPTGTRARVRRPKPTPATPRCGTLRPSAPPTPRRATTRSCATCFRCCKRSSSGTRYSIHVDPADGLLYAGEPGVQLTWMDAKPGALFPAAAPPPPGGSRRGERQRDL